MKVLVFISSQEMFNLPRSVYRMLTDYIFFPSLFEKTFSLMFIANNLTKPCRCNYRFCALDICSRRSVPCSCRMSRCLLSYDWSCAHLYRCWFTTLILWYVLDCRIVYIGEAPFKLLSLKAAKNTLQFIHHTIAVSLLIGLHPLIINSPMRKFPFNQGQ